MEASFTAPFHFINQAELSEEPSDAISGISYPSLDISNGLTHLQLMNIPYLLTVSSQVTSAVKADPRATLLGTFGDYNVFRIAGASGYVQVMQNEPVRLNVSQGDWRNVAVNWYENPTDLTTPLVWDQGQPALKKLKSITPDEVTNPPVTPTKTSGVGLQRSAHRRHSFVRHDRHWRAALDQDLLLPQLARHRGGRSLFGLSLVHDGHSHTEPRHSLLRTHQREQPGPDPGSDRLARACRYRYLARDCVAEAKKDARGKHGRTAEYARPQSGFPRGRRHDNEH